MKKYFALSLIVATGCDATVASTLISTAIDPSTWTNLITIVKTITSAVS